MAGSRRTQADQWRPEDSGPDRQVSRRSPLRNPRASRSRSRSLPRGATRRRHLSSSPPRRETDAYRPTHRGRRPSSSPRRRRRTPPPPRHRHRQESTDRYRNSGRRYSPEPVHRRDRSPSPRRPADSYVPARRGRSRSPISSTYRPEYASAGRRQEFHPDRSYRPNPARPEPPHGARKRKASRSPPRSSRRHSPPTRRDISPGPRSRRDYNDRPPRSRSPPPPARPSRRERKRQAAAGSRTRTRSGRRRERNTGRESQDREREDDMSYGYYSHRGGPPRPQRYDYPPPSGAGTPFMSAHQNSASPSPYNPPGRGGYGGYGGYAGYQGSPHHGYPPQHTPYRQNCYPPAGSPYHQGPPSHYGGSPYGPSHGYPPHRGGYHERGRRGSFQGPPDRRSSLDSRPGSDASGPPRGGRGRGRYQNLSWTPDAGRRGGGQIPAKDGNESRDNAHAGEDEDDNPFRPSKDLQSEDRGARDRREREFQRRDDREKQPVDDRERQRLDERLNQLSDETEKLRKIEREVQSREDPATQKKPDREKEREEDDDNDSRMSMSISPQSPGKETSPVITAFRSQPEHTTPTTEKQLPPKPEMVPPTKPANEPSQDTPRISSFTKRRREPRKELRKIERIKPRPRVDPEHAKSDSVYFRKPGNESVVGSGTYGKVFKAIHVYTKEKVALKKIRMEGERDGFPVTAIREVKLLQSLHSPYVVSLREVMVERNDCYMVFEYLSHDLTGLLNHPTFKLTAPHKKHLARQLFAGLDYLHKRSVLHRDIKAANILISSNGQLKLADFGLARFYAKRRQIDYTNRVITIWYRSPELLLGETQYGPEVDIWSAACVLVEIFTRHAIFPGDGGEISQLDKIYHVLGTPSVKSWPGLRDLAWFELLRPPFEKPSTFAEKYADKMSPQAFDLLSAMLAYDPKARPSASDVLKHAYFSSEEPAEERLALEDIGGDWHEFESKALRKEKERQEYEKRRAKAKETERKRVSEEKEREAKRRKVEEGAGEGGVGAGVGVEDGGGSDGEALMLPPD